MRELRGSAADQDCARCGRTASEWAYDHSDPNEQTDARSGLAYSTDATRYQPMCRHCHREYDNEQTGRRARCGTRAGYDRHRRVTHTPACEPCKAAIAAIGQRRKRRSEITEYEVRP